VAVSGVTIPARTIPIPVSAIQTPSADGSNHATILRQIKESVEVAARQRGDPSFSYVRANELVALGLATMVNGALQLTGGSAAGASSIPAGVGAGGVSGPGVGAVGATGAVGLSAIAQAMYPEDQDDAAPFARFQLSMLDQMGSKVGGVPYRTAKGWVATPLQTLTLGLPVLIQDDPDDQLMIPGATGAVGAAGKAGTNAMFVWPDDPEDPMIVPGTPGAVGATGSSGAPGLPGASSPVVTWPDDPDDAHIVPGPIGLTGIVGPAGFNAPQLYPDDMEDSLIVPGPQGLRGLTGASGYNAPQLYPDDPDDPLIIPGPTGGIGVTGLQGVIGSAGINANVQWADDPDDPLIIPGLPGATGAAGAPGAAALFAAWAAYGDCDMGEDSLPSLYNSMDMNYPYTWMGPQTFNGLVTFGSNINQSATLAAGLTCNFTNLSTNAASFMRLVTANQSHSLQFIQTSTAYSGSWLTGGTTGESANITTQGNVPLNIGVNNTCVAQFATSGAMSLLYPPSMISTTGAQTATFAATNKPGTATTGPSAWVEVYISGVLHYMPAFL